jgi:membrane protease YdiL (CAAX protease family)
MESRRPWSPDPSWADPLIITLALFCLLGVSLSLRGRAHAAPAATSGPTLQGRVLELSLGARLVMGAPAVGLKQELPKAKDLPHAADRAIASVLMAEGGKIPEARELLAAAPQPSASFQKAFEMAYGSQALSPAGDLRSDLGQGLALHLIQAKLAPRSDQERLRKSALDTWMKRFVLLSAFGMISVALLLTGLGTAVWLALSRQPWPQPYAWRMSGRALLLVLLGWFAVFFLSSLFAASLTAASPALKAFGIPLGYVLHATAGIAFICKAEGWSWQDLKTRLFPGPAAKSLAFAPLFTGLGLAAALLAGLLLAPLVRGRGNPQQELMEGLMQLKGWLPTITLFLTVAVLAPFFEELMMRGVLMGWLRTRKGPALALAVSALVFGAIHLQPLALPTLSLLGAAFGLGVQRSGDLRTSMLAHGLWNGGLFLFLRLLV